MGHQSSSSSFFVFLSSPETIVFIAFREGGRKRNIDAREKNGRAASRMCLDWGRRCPRLDRGSEPQPRNVPWSGLNLQPFAAWRMLPPPESHGPGRETSILKFSLLCKQHYDSSGNPKRIKTNYVKRKQYKGKKPNYSHYYPKNTGYVFFPIFFLALSYISSQHSFYYSRKLLLFVFST